MQIEEDKTSGYIRIDLYKPKSVESSTVTFNVKIAKHEILTDLQLKVDLKPNPLDGFTRVITKCALFGQRHHNGVIISDSICEYSGIQIPIKKDDFIPFPMTRVLRFQLTNISKTYFRISVTYDFSPMLTSSQAGGLTLCAKFESNNSELVKTDNPHNRETVKNYTITTCTLYGNEATAMFTIDVSKNEMIHDIYLVVKSDSNLTEMSNERKPTITRRKLSVDYKGSDLLLLDSPYDEYHEDLRAIEFLTNEEYFQYKTQLKNGIIPFTVDPEIRRMYIGMSMKLSKFIVEFAATIPEGVKPEDLFSLRIVSLESKI